MSQTNESRATDPAIANISNKGLNTSEVSKFHTSTQTKTTPATDHQRALSMLGFAFELDETDTWLGTVGVLKARLSDHELAALSFVALKAQKPDDATMTAEAVLGQFDTPVPPLVSAMDEAAHWADWAAPNYVKAVVLAGYNRMSAKDQSAFLDFVDVRAAA